MVDGIEFTIFGEDLQSVDIKLDPEEMVRAEAGAMLYMENVIKM